jgi:putative transcriptional regulator
MTLALCPGRLLVAASDLDDPNFKRAVILLCRVNDQEGAVGLIVNRPTGLPVGKALPKLAGNRVESIWIGGPVDARALFVLHRMPYMSKASEEVLPGLYMTTDCDAIQQILKLCPPDPEGELLRPCVGYAGWGPGQLESELESGSWHVVSAPPPAFFQGSPTSLWREMLVRSILIADTGQTQLQLN